MKKLRMETKDQTQANIEQIAELFPNVITEMRDADGQLKKGINFELLKQELSSDVIDGEECYDFTWVGKKSAMIEANTKIRKTLRPVIEESKDWESTENLYIEGDNLDALKLLQESYLNSVKMIYIDPPYNTGNDSFVYPDNYIMDVDEYDEGIEYRDEEGNINFRKNTETNPRFHSDWCSMMYPRLKLARNLLSEDGVILISIDENEFHNLKKICDEIFGIDNFGGEIVWKNSSKNDQAYVSMQHEYIVCFVKSKAHSNGDWREKKDGLDEIFEAFEGFRQQHGDDWEQIHKEALAWYRQFPESNPVYSSKHYSWMDERGVYFAADISGPRYGQYRYDVIHPRTGKVCKAPASGWRYPEVTMLQRIEDNLVHFGEDETTIPNNKVYLTDTQYQSLTSVKYKDGRVASNELKQILGGNFFTNPKDAGLLASIFTAVGVGHEDVVLDFFAGSSTTAHSVMQLNAEDGGNRKFIMVQLPEEIDQKSEAYKAGYRTISDIGKERIRRAGEKIKNEVEESNSKLKEGEEQKRVPDIGFRVLRVDSTNMNDVYYAASDVTQDLLTRMESNVKDDRRDLDLLYGVLVDWGLPLSLSHEMETIDGVTVHTVDEGSLIACFAEDISESVVREIAKRQPLRVVFRDSSFASSPGKINVTEIFKLLSPNTSVRVI